MNLNVPINNDETYNTVILEKNIVIHSIDIIMSNYVINSELCIVLGELNFLVMEDIF